MILYLCCSVASIAKHGCWALKMWVVLLLPTWVLGLHFLKGGRKEKDARNALSISLFSHHSYLGGRESWTSTCPSFSDSRSLSNGSCGYLSGICLSAISMHPWLPLLYGRLQRQVFILRDAVACLSELAVGESLHLLQDELHSPI